VIDASHLSHADRIHQGTRLGRLVPQPMDRGTACAASGFDAVGRFVGKPSPDVAAQLFAAGAVWNTMVMVARASALFSLYEEHLPALSKVFRSACRARTA
jgi:mannose-1-phosphate guanylyltransferase